MTMMVTDVMKSEPHFFPVYAKGSEHINVHRTLKPKYTKQ